MFRFSMKRLIRQYSSQIRNVSSNFILSILATVINTIARQIVVFPLLAYRLSESDNGTFLTVIALSNVYSLVVGNTLNNIRLIEDSRYEEAKVQGDFNFLCSLYALGAVPFHLILWYLFPLQASTGISLILYGPVAVFYAYAIVHFYKKLDFRHMLFCNIIAGAGYILGALFFATATSWPLIFLCGEGLGLIYVEWKTHFLQESWKKTALFVITCKKHIGLMGTSLVGNLLTYADRMLIYPILGAASVSYYTTASFLGKSASVMITPISTVLLGYFSRQGYQISRKRFMLINGFSLGCLGIFLLGCYILGPWFTQLLYPSLYDASRPYLFLANLGAVLSVAFQMAQPMILKFCAMKWNFCLWVLYALCYVAGVVLLMPEYGLYGFCVATIFASGVRLLAAYLLGMIQFK